MAPGLSLAGSVPGWDRPCRAHGLDYRSYETSSYDRAGANVYAGLVVCLSFARI